MQRLCTELSVQVEEPLLDRKAERSQSPARPSGSSMATIRLLSRCAMIGSVTSRSAHLQPLHRSASSATASHAWSWLINLALGYIGIAAGAARPSVLSFSLTKAQGVAENNRSAAS